MHTVHEKRAAQSGPVRVFAVLKLDRNIAQQPLFTPQRRAISSPRPNFSTGVSSSNVSKPVTEHPQKRQASLQSSTESESSIHRDFFKSLAMQIKAAKGQRTCAPPVAPSHVKQDAHRAESYRNAQVLTKSTMKRDFFKSFAKQIKANREKICASHVTTAATKALPHF